MPRTKVKQKQLYERRNTSDVFSRLIIMGLLRVLNMKLVYEQIWSDTEDGIEKITVPFFYDFTGGSATSERFIQDNYINWTDDECTSMGIKKMDGDYKPIPYGVITLGSTSIDSGNISNRFVMGQYQKKVGDSMESFVSFLYSIPLTYSFSVTIKCDTTNTMWKIEQAFREYFYKNKTYHVNYKGTIVPVRVGFPDSLSNEKTPQYTVGQQNEGFDIKITFDISCETYQPVFDPYSEMKADKNIHNFGLGIGLRQSQLNEPEHTYIKPMVDLSGKVMTGSQEVYLSWRYNYDLGDLITVDILYETEDGQEEIIDTVVNNNFYYLTIPDNLLDTDNTIDVMFPNTDTCTVYTTPEVKLYPDFKTGIVNRNNIVIVNKGYFLTTQPTVDAIVSYINKKHKIVEQPVKFRLKNNMIDESEPLIMDDFIYNNKICSKKIKIKVRDSFNNKKFAYFHKNDNNVTDWLTIV